MQQKTVMLVSGFVLVLLLLVLSNSPSLAQEVGGKPPLKIVQLGDSYSAGNGARSESGEPNYYGVSDCYRSPTNWEGQFANSLKELPHVQP